MARNDQYKYMNKELIGPALLCIICKKPFKDPQCTPCNHIFCRECLTRWMRTNGLSCPACLKFVSADNLLPISHTLSHMLDTLRVKCKLCGQTELLRGNFDDHINAVCPNVRVSCPSAHNACLWIGQRHQLNNHLSYCSFQSFPSVFSELFAENRQFKEQCQQQLSQIQRLQTHTQRQRIEIERVDQQYQQQLSHIQELQTETQCQKVRIEHADQQCQQQLSHIQELQTETQRQKAEIELVNERCNQHETQIKKLTDQIADIADSLSTKKFLSKQPLALEEKSYYEECKEYYKLTKEPLISVPDEVFDDSIELPSSLIKFGIDEDCHKFDLRDFLRKFCDKLNLDINDIVVKQIQSGSAILEAEIYNKFESKDKKLGLKMIYHKLTDKFKKELAKMKIFFMFMGPIKSLFKMQKHRSEIKLNPQYNRIYSRGYNYWDGACNDGIDRGNKPYYCPVGWQRQSFYVTENFDEKFKGWCICYHGTKFEYGLSILLSGLKPAETAAHGAGIYATPSINYACHPRYAENKLIESSYQKKFRSGKYVQFVLECRVHPTNIKKIARETLSAGNITIDTNITNDVIEWVIDNQKKTMVDFNDPDASIICTGLLTRVTDNHPGLLPESQWWYESHLCNQPKCCLLGIDLEDLKRQRQNGDICNVIFN